MIDRDTDALQRAEHLRQQAATNAAAAELTAAKATLRDATYMVEQLQQQRNDWVTRANEYARERDDAREELAEASQRVKALEDALLPFVALHPEMFRRADGLIDLPEPVDLAALRAGVAAGEAGEAT